MKKIDFKPVELNDLDDIYKYTSKYGEGSCQHSPVSMYSASEKYGDEFCILDDTLFVLRKNLCDETYRVYLAPLGNGDIKEGFEKILSDAAQYGKKVKFLTLTDKYANELSETFPSEFEIVKDRDLSEYMYETVKMSTYSGRSLKKRRSEVNSFWTRYGQRAEVRLIEEKDHKDIIDFERKWVEINRDTHDVDALEREERMIKMQLSVFDKLGLSGIVLRIDGAVCGFGYGSRLSDDFYDAIIEKGDKNVPYIYKVLRMESVKQCAMECKYVNMEEDVGIEGLRALKYSYRPAYLLDKNIAIQKDGGSR